MRDSLLVVSNITAFTKEPMTRSTRLVILIQNYILYGVASASFHLYIFSQRIPCILLLYK